MSRGKPTILSHSQRADSRQQQSIDALAAETNKEFGAGTIVRASDMLAPPPRLSTGSLWFDLALGGGWPVNAWSEIVGQESSGKTAVAYSTIATGMKGNSDFTALWCAAEPFDADYARSIGVDLNRLWVLEENTMELVYAKCTEYVEKRSVDMAVIDAYPSLITDAEDTAFIGDAQVSPGARLTGKFMRAATKATKRSMIDPNDRPFTGLFINQWRDKVGVVFGDPRTTPGGKGKNFWFASRVEVSRAEWIKDSEAYAVGQKIKMNVFKNKSARPRREGLCDFYFDEYDGHTLGDFDFAGEVFELSVGLEVVERRGNTYYFGDQKLATTKRDFEAMIRSEERLCHEIAAAIWRKELGTEPRAIAGVTPMPRRPRARPRAAAAAA